MSNHLARLSVPAVPDPADASAYARWQWAMSLAAYEALAARPRRPHAWAYVKASLWHARAEALKHGLRRGSGLYAAITARIEDVDARLDQARLQAASDPHADVRV